MNGEEIWLSGSASQRRKARLTSSHIMLVLDRASAAMIVLWCQLLGVPRCWTPCWSDTYLGVLSGERRTRTKNSSRKKKE